MGLKNRNILKNKQGFTIVELLIVVVVIAILAAITIVAYNGITSQARESTLKSDLITAAKKLHTEKIGADSFPLSKPGYISSEFDYDSTGSTFCVTGKAGAKDFYVSEAGSVGEGSVCPYIPPAGSMQAFTAAECAALPVFTGANTTAIRTATDARGGATRTYEIAKLADSNCWMLNNLKLGSTTSATTLTPIDSDVASNFTLPQLITSGSTSYDTPYAYGPVPGDTGVGATNYGYLYNWPAATAGESRTSHPAAAGNAPHSICPANWRLPTGSATGEFAWLNAKMNNPDDTAPSTAGGTGYYQNWNFSGPLRGVFSGYRDSGLFGQGNTGRLWSSSANPSDSSSAFLAYFSSGSAGPAAAGINRNFGYGVRCLLN